MDIRIIIDLLLTMKFENVVLNNLKLLIKLKPRIHLVVRQSLISACNINKVLNLEVIC